MPKIISDSEMMQLEEKSRPKAFISDSDMAAMEKEESKASVGKTFGLSAANAATLGYLPELQAAADKIIFAPGMGEGRGKFGASRKDDSADAKLKAQGFTIRPLEESFVDSREGFAKEIDQAARDNPTAALAGTVVGAVGGGAVLAPFLPAAAPGAGVLTRLAKAGQAGAVLGAGQNPQQVEGEYNPIQIMERLKSGGIGAVVGAASQAAIEGVSKGAKAVSDSFRGKAEEKAFKILGGTPTQRAKAQASKSDHQIGRQLLDDDLVGPLTSAKKLSERVDTAREAAGKEVGELIKSASGPEKVIDAKAISDRLRTNPEIAEMGTVPGLEGKSEKIQAMFDTLAKKGGMSLDEAHRYRQQIDKAINFAKKTNEMPEAMQVLVDMRSAIRDEMNTVINGIDEASGGTASNRLITKNKRYSNLSTADDMLDRTLARQAGNQTISLGDKIAGAAGTVIGGASSGAVKGSATAGIALALANKAARTFGNSAAAKSYDAIAKTMAHIPAYAEAATSKPAVYLQTLDRVTAFVNGRDKLSPAEVDPIMEDPHILGIFKADPSLIEQIQDPMRRALIKRQIDRGPGMQKRK